MRPAARCGPATAAPGPARPASRPTAAPPGTGRTAGPASPAAPAPAWPAPPASHARGKTTDSPRWADRDRVFSSKANRFRFSGATPRSDVSTKAETERCRYNRRLARRHPVRMEGCINLCARVAGDFNAQVLLWRRDKPVGIQYRLQGEIKPQHHDQTKQPVFSLSHVGRLRRRTTQLSSGGGRVSYESQKAYIPPPSAAAPGSACRCSAGAGSHSAHRSMR